jgi:arginine:agmatine antiporter
MAAVGSSRGGMIRSRKIGPFLATVLVTSNMVGSGIFLLPATLGGVGSITIVGWGICTVGALLIAAVLAKLGRLAPLAGGPCAYAGEAMGPYMGFQSSAIYWIACWVSNIAIAVAAVGYLASFFPTLATPLHAAVATAGLIWLLTVANIVGPRFVCQLEAGATAVGVLPILLIALAGWWFFSPRLFLASWNVTGEPAFKVIPNSLALIFWAFTGLESASIATAVVENPARNVPLATIAGVLIAALIYISSSTVILGLIPAAQLARSTAPFADAARIILGPAVGTFVAVTALIKTIGTLGGWVLLTAETARAGAQRGIFPALFARVDRAGIPVLNLLALAVLMTLVVFATMAPTLGEQFGKLIDVAVVLTILVYVYACVAMWHYSVPPVEGAPASRHGGLGLYRLIALAAMAFSLLVIALSDAKLLALSATAVFLTYPLYPFFMQPIALKPGSP